MYYSLSITRIVKLRRMRSVGYVERWAEEEWIYDTGGKDRAYYEDQDIGGWTILRWISERQDREEWIGFIWLRTGTSGGLL
jgi:hypothetical protein